MDITIGTHHIYRIYLIFNSNRWFNFDQGLISRKTKRSSRNWFGINKALLDAANAEIEFQCTL